MKLLLVAILIIIVNLPFGMWAAREKLFSLKWFLAIHIPIPIIVSFRFLFEIGFELYTYPIFIVAFFLGQYTGKRIGKAGMKRIKNSGKE